MPNPYFTPSGYPATNAAGSSASMRSELTAIEAGFNLLPTLSGNANKLVLINPTGTGMTVSSTLSESGSALTITGTVSGTAITSLFASPPAIGGTTAGTGRFTTVTATGLTNTRVPYVSTGGLLIDSANLTFDGTAITSTFSGPHNGTVGATTPAAGSFTTLSASSTVSGAGFSSYLASPPAIGGTTAAAGSFTTLTTSSTVTLNALTASNVPYLNGSKQLITGNLFYNGFWLRTGTNATGSQQAGFIAYASATAAFKLLNDTTGQTATDGTDLELSGSDFNIINREAANITLHTSATERMRIDSSGNVGVGRTPSGTAVIDVQSTAAAIVRVRGNTGTNQGSAVFGTVGNDTTSWAIGSRATMYGGTPGNDTGVYSFGTLSLGTVGVERVFIDASGNVGVGVSNPGTFARFVVWGGSGSMQVQSTAASPGVGARLILSDSNNSVFVESVMVGSASDMAFRTSGTERMRIDASGNVGVGTTAPGARLEVNGNVNLTSSTARVGYLAQTDTGTVSGVTVPSYGIGWGTFTGFSGAGVGLFGYYGLIFGTSGLERMRITATGNIVAGASAALATTATDGFLYVPTCAGTPAGTPTAITGMAPIVVNTTNNKLYFYSGGAWRDAGP